MKTFTVLAAFALAAIAPAWGDTIANQDVPFSLTGVPDSCSSELVDVSGIAHFVLSEALDGAGGLHASLHVNVEAKGVGETSGAAYVGNAELNANLNNLGKGSAQNLTVIVNARLNGQGSVANANLKVTFHVTASPDGTVTAEVVNLSLGC